MEGIDRFIPNFFYTMLKYLWDYIPMIMCLNSMTLASCSIDLDQNRAVQNQSKTVTPISNANISAPNLAKLILKTYSESSDSCL